MIRIHCCKDPVELAQKACQWLVGLVASHIKCETRPFVLGLSGGSTPRALYQQLALTDLDWNQIQLIWGDERNVPSDHTDSNFLMVQQNLLSKISIPVENVIAIPNAGGDVSLAAAAYQRLLRDRLPRNCAGETIVDCMLLGMGEDVHTASLFPQTEALKDCENWFVANYVDKFASWRLTATAAFINRATDVAFLIAGAGKQTALQQLWNSPLDSLKFPSQLISPNSGNLSFFVDRAAIANVNFPSGAEIIE